MVKELKQKRSKIKRQIEYYMGRHLQQDKNESFKEEQSRRIQQTIETLNHAADRIDTF